MNTSVDSTLLSKLGVQYNFSDGASLENDSGDGAVAASLTVDLVQRFNFSVSVDGVITFRSPPANKNGYASLLVFDKAGASTVLAESIFYNLKVQPHMVGHSLAATSNRPLTMRAFSETARLCSVPRPAGTGVGRLARPARRCGTLVLGRFLGRSLEMPLHRPSRDSQCVRHMQLQPWRSWAGRRLSRWLPHVARKRLLEQRRGSNASRKAFS